MADLRLVSGNDDGGNGEHNNVGNGDVVRMWERQPSETNRSFAAFNEYLQMGPQRSLSKLAQKLGKSTTLLSGWSARHDWMRRVRAFQHYENRMITERIVEGTAAMRERHAMLGQQLQARAQTRILKMNEQEINDLHPVDAAAMLRVGSELERTARKMEEGDPGFGWEVPTPNFVVQVIRPGHDVEGNRMVGVQITSGPEAGRYGYIPEGRVRDLRRDHPDWRVLA